MKVAAKGKVWSVPNPARTNAASVRFVLGCERCRSTCTGDDPCKCCRNHKPRTPFPDDGKGHCQIMPMTEFREIYRSEPVV